MTDLQASNLSVDVIGSDEEVSDPSDTIDTLSSILGASFLYCLVEPHEILVSEVIKEWSLPSQCPSYFDKLKHSRNNSANEAQNRMSPMTPRRLLLCPLLLTI
jgi:hypothetical protein